MAEEESAAFSARPSGRGVCPEYRASLAQVVVAPSLMGTSVQRAKLAHLRSSAAGSTSDAELSALLTSLVRKACGAASSASDEFVRRICSDALGVLDGPACLFYGSRVYVSSLRWERELLVAGLRQLLSTSDGDGLLIILGLMTRGANECESRKRAVFSTIVNLCAGAGGSSGGAGSGGAGSGGAGSGSSSGSGVKDSGGSALLGGDEGEVAASKARLFSASVAFLDDLKTRAVASTFGEPTAAYADAAGEHTLASDADVHGVSSYLALLQGATGIVTSRLPALDDEAKGMADFLRAGGFRPLINALWAPENLGKSWRAMPEALRSTPLTSYVAAHAFIWRGYVREVATMAGDASAHNAESRAAFAPYVAQFCSYFAAPTFLQRLFSHLTASDGPEAERALLDLNIVLRDLLRRERAMAAPAAAAAAVGSAAAMSVSMLLEDDDVDVRSALWDMEASPPTFRVDAAHRLFAAIGIASPPGHALEPFDAPGEAPGGGSAAAAGECIAIPASAIALSAAGDIRGGGTGREVLTNLLLFGSEPWSKWVHPGYVTRSWVQAVLSKGPWLVTGYSVCSANDCPDRDPTSWRLMGCLIPSASAAGAGDPAAAARAPSSSKLRAGGSSPTWVELHSVAAPGPFQRRWQWHKYSLEKAVTISALRLEIFAVRRPGDGLQMGHFHILGKRADV